MPVKESRASEISGGGHSKVRKSPCLLDHQDPRDHAGRNRRRRGFHVDEPGLPGWQRHFRRVVYGHGRRPDLREKISSLSLLADVVATTTVGTTLADFADRSLGIGYAGGTAILLTLLLASLFIWYRTLGSVAVDTVSSPNRMFYWVTIMFSQTLGTALGDWTADTGLGYGGGALFWHRWRLLRRRITGRDFAYGVVLGGFILTRPLGAVVGDFLDKPVKHGGLALDRFSPRGLAVFIIGCILIFRQRAERQTPSDA